jgi:hypothetical protein
MVAERNKIHKKKGRNGEGELQNPVYHERLGLAASQARLFSPFYPVKLPSFLS